MADVARAAGVSVTTVSHVLNGTRAVNDHTRQQVRDAIGILGYRRNTVARALATARTMIAGICVPITANSTFPVMVDVMERLLAEQGYSVVLHNTRDDPETQHRVVEHLLDLRADGVVLAPALASVRLPSQLPVVLLDRFADADCDQVASDGTDPVDELTSHLAAQGHRRIAVTVGHAELSTTDDRFTGYRQAVARLGLDTDPALVIHGASDVATTQVAIAELFAAPNPPTAVVSTNNVMTIGTLRGLTDLGLTVPGDVALVCYDDFEWADVVTPRLTAMEQDLTGMATRAVELLLRRIADPAAPAVRERLPVAFHHRSSCGCAPHPDGPPAPAAVSG